jgi:hypothetical protein
MQNESVRSFNLEGVDTMATCNATKQNGEQCGAKCAGESPFCKRHAGVEGACRHRYFYKGKRHSCTKMANDTGYCAKHHEMVERKRKQKEMREWANRIWREVQRMVWDENELLNAARFIRFHQEQGHIDDDHFLNMTTLFGNEVARYDQSERLLGRRPFDEPVFPPVREYDPLLSLADQENLWGPQGTPDRPGLSQEWLDDMVMAPVPLPPAHAGEVGRLAFDPQNVHTREVNSVVSEGLDILLSVTDPVNGFEGYWATVPLTRKNRAMHRDMEKWYNTESCRSESDWLYRKVLDGLWTLINRSAFRDELMDRLTQELDESVTMCCDGHIARLCNVMVGFDDAFRSPVSISEVLGNRIGAISALDISVEAKVIEAWGVFEELHVDHETRKEWISAL